MTPNPHHSPECLLVACVIRQAIEDVLRPAAQMIDYQSAERWLAERSHRPWGFHWCCSAMDIHPDDIREAMAKEPKAILRRISHFNRATRESPESEI